MATKKKSAAIAASPLMPKKAKPVTGAATKLKKLDELRKVNKQIEVIQKADNKRYEKTDKLYDKARKLRDQLGV